MAILSAILPILKDIFNVLLETGVLGDFVKWLFKPETASEHTKRTLDESIAGGDLLNLGRINEEIARAVEPGLSADELKALKALGGL